MNIQSALEAPRFNKTTFGGCGVSIENRVPVEIRDGLTGRGHQLRVTGDFSDTMGGGQAVVHDSAAQINYGASDPRKDGAAVPEPHPYFTKSAPGRR
jgi:gamma-glutamyltranspeptidase/glutathione hydrolase